MDAAQLVADVLTDYGDELTQGACDRCEQCGPVIMCNFHSVLSALTGRTPTHAAAERKRRLDACGIQAVQVLP